MPKKVKFFAAYCPLGSRCSYGNSQLGKYEDESAARRKIYTHLTESSRHYCKKEEADELTRDAEIKSWEEDYEEVPEPAEASKGKGLSSTKGGGRSSSSHEGGKAKGKHNAHRRQGPYEPPMPPDGGVGIDYQQLANMVADQMHNRQSELLLAQAAAEEQLAAVAPAQQQVQMTELFQHWNRAVNALARGHATLSTCSRLCRSAAATFDEEAHNVQREMDFLASLQVHPDFLAPQ